jgi:hypothetical protein
MPYKAEISRSNPSCILFLIDQSSSMREQFSTSDGEKTKAEAVSDVINRALQTLVSKCTKSEGIHDYYQIGVIGYSGMGVSPALAGQLAGRELVPISLIGTYPVRIDKRIKKVQDAKGNTVERKLNFPVWLDPVSAGGTPMCAAFSRAVSILSRWIGEHPGCFPPIVINITDGESSDGDPLALGGRLMQMHSSDGNVLLFNLHVSSTTRISIEYPESGENLPDDFARELFNISSPLTGYMVKVLNDDGLKCGPKARGFVFNADFTALLRFIDIGTRPRDLRVSSTESLNELFPS